MKLPTIKEIEWTIECLPEDTPIRGNYIVSGDDEYDRQQENETIRESEWNEWAWCTVRVVGQYMGIEYDDYLGCCSYKSKQDFMADDGCYPDMQKDVQRQIHSHIERIVKAALPFINVNDI